MVQCLACYELCELNNLVWSWPNTINKILKCQKEGLNTVTPSEKWPLEMYPLLNMKRYLVEEQTGIPHSDPLYENIGKTIIQTRWWSGTCQLKCLSCSSLSPQNSYIFQKTLSLSLQKEKVHTVHFQPKTSVLNKYKIERMSYTLSW